MPQFNLDEYELVEDRIRRFYEDHPDGRIVTIELTSHADREKGYFVVRAEIFIDHEDQHAGCPKATGMAFEVEGTAGANRTAALENAETSAIGRALANADYAKGKRPSRTEMEKAQAGPPVRKADGAIPVDPEFLDKIKKAKSLEELTTLWGSAVENGLAEKVRYEFSTRRKALENEQT
jgi:hypothetical protein